MENHRTPPTVARKDEAEINTTPPHCLLRHRPSLVPLSRPKAPYSYPYTQTRGRVPNIHLCLPSSPSLTTFSSSSSSSSSSTLELSTSVYKRDVSGKMQTRKPRATGEGRQDEAKRPPPLPHCLARAAKPPQSPLLLPLYPNQRAVQPFQVPLGPCGWRLKQGGAYLTSQITYITLTSDGLLDQEILR